MDIGRHLTRLQHQMVFNLIYICVLFVGTGVSVALSACVWNADGRSQVSLRCPGPRDRIRVTTVLYLQLTSQPQQCRWYGGDDDNVTCLHRIDHLPSAHPLTQCTGLAQGCTAAIGPPPPGSNCTTYNYFYMWYDCIPETDIIDLCGERKTVVVDASRYSAGQELAYFPSAGDPPTRDCTCVIQGRHSLRSNYVGVPQTNNNNCFSASLTINWTIPGTPDPHHTLAVDNGLTLEDIIYSNYRRNDKVNIAWIRYTRNCSTLRPPVWFSTYPGGQDDVTITCGNAVAPKTSTTVTTSSTTGTTRTTKQSDIAVIAGSVTGGLLLIVVVILVCVLYRARKGGQTARPPPSASLHMAPQGTGPVRDAGLDEETLYAEISVDPVTQQHQGTPRPHQQTSPTSTAASSQDGQTVGRVGGITDALTDTQQDYLTPRSKAPPNISKTRADNQKSKSPQLPNPPSSSAPSQEYQNVGRVGGLGDIVYYNAETSDKEKVYLPLSQSEPGLGGDSYAALNVGKAKTDNR